MSSITHRRHDRNHVDVIGLRRPHLEAPAERSQTQEDWDDWFREQIEAALADDSPGIPHEQVMHESKESIRKTFRDRAGKLARKTKRPRR